MKKSITKQRITRVTMTLLVMMLTSMTAWADGIATLMQDGDEWYVNMPSGSGNVTNTLTITADDIAAGKGTFKVYDNGGKGGQYSTNCTGILVLTAPQNYVIQLSGDIYTETNWDKLTVYDNNEASGTTLLNEKSSSVKGVKTSIGTIISSANVMTIKFSSDGSGTYDGLDLTVTVVDPNADYVINGLGSATGGRIVASVGGENATTAKANNVVNLTATPDNTYVLSGISVTDASSNPVAVTWDGPFSNTATFTMPASVVTVTPTFSNNISVNMPKTGSKELDIPSGVQSFKVYDDGGKDDKYSNNYEGTLVLTAPVGHKIRLSGSITLESYDKLTVYNGSKESGTKLLDAVSSSSSGTKTDITTFTSTGDITSTDNVMTIYFKSDGLTNFDGLDLTVLVFDPNADHNVTVNPAEGGSVTANPTSAKVNETITLTATPDNTYVLSGISVTDASSNPVAVTGGKWYDNTATFTMPGSVATVTPTFSDNLTAAGGLYINMPVTGDQIVEIPAGVESFKVYDDGGKDNNHSQNCTGTLVLTAPENHLLRLSGKITTDPYDYLTVYDGSKENGSKLLNEVRSTSSGTETDIKPITSMGNVMTIYFYTNNFYEEAGLDLTVTVVNPNTEYNVNVINPAEGGSVTASPTSAKVNETVTLTATPASGYLLSGISVTDDGSNSVAVTWDGSFSNTATFTMPGCDVTVTPTFTDNLTAAGGLYINMPATDSKTITIPSGVQSFKVYDDGGKDGNYSNYYDGTLVMTAPTGYVLQLSGGVTAESSDKLTVYDGSTTNSTKLIDAMGGIGSTKKDISIVTSSGNVMMLFFHSDYSMNYAGLDLTVTLMPTYTITYNLNEGTNATGNPATYTANTETFTLVDPSRDGYEFAGWFSDSEFNTPATTTITKGSTGDKTFWAKWKKLMTNADITVTIPEKAWTGSELTPDITVKDGETPLTLNTDYTVNAPSGTIQDTGDYTYNITGVGNYAGSKEATFTIIAKETTLGAATIVQDQNGNTAIFDGTSTETINITEDVTVNSVIYNRTFNADKPATVMLPFSLGEGQTLTGGTLYKFTGVTKNNEGKWEATMTEATTLQANTPCLLMPNNGLTDGKVTFNLNSTTVTLNTNGGGNCQTADHGSHWMFKGTYSYKEWISGGANDEEIGKVYGFAGVAKGDINVGDFVKVASGAKIRPMGCYLLWNDEPNPSRAAARSAATEELPQSITVRLISANGEVTGIGEIDTKTGEMTFDSEAWYTLNGVRLSGKPTKKGLYINNGRKVVVK